MEYKSVGNLKSQGTSTEIEVKETVQRVEKQYKSIVNSELTINGGTSIYEKRLPTELDIFCNLPESVYENADAKLFLDCLRFALLNKFLRGEIDNVILTKLRLSEQTDFGITLEWIFNYFRLFFSFDTVEGNIFGIIEVNDEQKKYKSEVQEIVSKNCDLLSESILDYVIMMLN